MSDQIGAINPAGWSFRPLDCASLPDGLSTWAAEQVKELGKPAWLLAFTLEGAAWGIMQDDALHLASEIYPHQVVDLSRSSLQEVFVFSAKGQAHAWLAGGQWKGALLVDGDPMQDDYFDQKLLLWGTRVDDWQDGFALLREGAQGLLQAVPLDRKPNLQANRQGAPALRMRNYLLKDKASGAAYIAAVRLVEIVTP